MPSNAEWTFQAVRHQLDRQEASLDDLRSRAATLLTGASILAGFLGTVIERNGGGLDCLGWAALSVFVVAAVLIVVVLVPTFTWRFSVGLPDIEDGGDGPEPILCVPDHETTLANASRRLQSYYEQNAGKLEVLMWLFTAAAILIVVDVVLWILALRG